MTMSSSSAKSMSSRRQTFSAMLALLFPIDWPEPFGLVMIEAMACGTPVIAFHCGSVPEVIDNATTGFVVGDLDEAVSAIQRIDRLNRTSTGDIRETLYS
jgi:glycosyltransferase involved in cell wall biosynthesis